MRVLRHECFHCGKAEMFQEHLVMVNGNPLCRECHAMFESMVETAAISNSKAESYDDLVEKVNQRKQWSKRK